MHVIEPVEIQFVKLAKRPLGYAIEDVDELLEDVAAAYEDVWRERDWMRAELDRLRSELEGRAVEAQAVDSSLARIDEVVGAALARAHAQAADILAGARTEAQTIVGDASQRHDVLRAEIRRLEAAEAEIRVRLRSILTAGLDLVEPIRGTAAPRAAQPAPAPSPPLDGDELTPA